MNALQLFLILKARKKLILLTLAMAVLIVGVATFLTPRSYTSSASLVVNAQAADPVTGNSMQSQFLSSYLATQIDVINSRNVALKVVDELKLAEQPAYQAAFRQHAQGRLEIRDWIANSLAGNLTVQTSRQSNVLNVSYKHENPQTAAQYANAFVRAYLQTNLELKTQPAQQTAAWYDAQMGALRSDLEKKQLKLSEYRQKKGLVSLDDALDTETARLGELSTQLAIAQGQTYDSLSNQRNASNASASVMSNPVIQTLKTDLARAESKLSQLAQREGRNYPEYQRADAEVSALRDKLAREQGASRQNLNSNLAVAQQREGALRAAVNAQKSRVLALNAQRDEAGVLARELDSAQKAYDQALQRYTQTRLEAHAGHTEVSVLSAAVAPMAPSTPNVPLNLLLASLLGLLLGIGIALVIEMLHRRVYSEYDLVEFLGVPVLGALIASDGRERRIFGRMALPAPKPI